MLGGHCCASLGTESGFVWTRRLLRRAEPCRAGRSRHGNRCPETWPHRGRAAGKMIMRAVARRPESAGPGGEGRDRGYGAVELIGAGEVMRRSPHHRGEAARLQIQQCRGAGQGRAAGSAVSRAVPRSTKAPWAWASSATSRTGFTSPRWWAGAPGRPGGPARRAGPAGASGSIWPAGSLGTTSTTAPLVRARCSAAMAGGGAPSRAPSETLTRARSSARSSTARCRACHQRSAPNPSRSLPHTQRRARGHLLRSVSPSHPMS
jgi:hypothetical protein